MSIFTTSNGSVNSFEKIKSAVDAGLDSIKFSINAGSKETYKLIHGKNDFEQVISNVTNLNKYRLENNIKLTFMFHLLLQNIHYMKRIINV